MSLIKPPNNISKSDKSKTSIFLAGSIEMGKAEDWQTRVIRELKKENKYVFYNPRRDDWDSSWTQDYENPQFYQQVNWELNALDKADKILLYLDPSTKSPISLLELGLYATSGKLEVVCPEGFWRKGNVDIVCDKYGIPLYDNLDELLIEYTL
jgi:hypothetical protein